MISLYGWKLDKQMVWDELKRLNSLENTPTNTHVLDDGSIWGDSVRSKKNYMTYWIRQAG